MNKSELVSTVADRTGLTKKDTDRVLNAVLDTITEALQAGEKVQLVGFGVFDIKERASRIGRNPRTKQEIEIAASRAPVFKAGKALKDAVAK